MAERNSRSPLLADLYQQYLESQDSTALVSQVAQRYTTGTLARLTEHRRREVRRAAVLVLGFVGEYEANHALGRALLDDDRTVRMIAENSLRSVWNRAGDEQQRHELGMIIRLNAAQHYQEALRRATSLIERAGAFAEAWHQRAVAQFHLKHFAETIRDCHEALEINPYHFPAASMMGHAYLDLGNQVSALESFRRALRLNPDLEGVRAHVVRLARLVEGK